MLVSFFVDDLAGNAVVRAAPLAHAVASLGNSVELIGFLAQSDQVYAPYRDVFPYRTIRANGTLRGKFRELASLANGDVVYACKPLPTSLLPALIASRAGLGRPLLLDVEDDEFWLGDANDGVMGSLDRVWRLRRLLALHPFCKSALETTVVSSRLQQRYGGTIVLHGPSSAVFNPALPSLDKRVARQRWNLGDRALVLFAGMPHAHKGLGLLVQALAHPSLSTLDLVLAVPPDHVEVRAAKARLGNRARCIGMVSHDLMPALLAAVDIVPTPQVQNAFTEAQIPAKLLEAMAMEKAVVASRVSDLPAILGEQSRQPRGWVFAPGNENELRRSLLEIATDPAEAARRGTAARTWFLENASTAAIAARLRPLLDRCRSFIGEQGTARRIQILRGK